MTRPHQVETLTQIELGTIDTLVFAGGGNRCWWQAGLLSRLQAEGWKLPRELVGTSAGAAVAAFTLAGRTQIALEACLKLYSQRTRIFDWRGLRRLRLHFAHREVYPAWIQSVLDQDGLQRLRDSGSRLRVAVTPCLPLLGRLGSVLIGTLAHLADKYIYHSIHAQLPQKLGLKPWFLDLQDQGSLDASRNLLCAAAAAPPFMPARQLQRRNVLDGGYADNAPVHAQNDAEQNRTLVLLTRHYAGLPTLFRWRGRNYWQPSQRVPVSTWDCTASTTVQAAFDLGVSDAIRLRHGEAISLQTV